MAWLRGWPWCRYCCRWSRWVSFSLQFLTVFHTFLECVTSNSDVGWMHSSRYDHGGLWSTPTSASADAYLFPFECRCSTLSFCGFVVSETGPLYQWFFSEQFQLEQNLLSSYWLQACCCNAWPLFWSIDMLICLRVLVHLSAMTCGCDPLLKAWAIAWTSNWPSSIWGLRWLWVFSMAYVYYTAHMD